MLPCSLPSVLKNRHIWPPANDSRSGAPSSPSSLLKTPVQTPFLVSWNENYVKRPTLLPCRQRLKNKNSKLSQEAAGGSGKTLAKTPPPGHEGWSSGIPAHPHSWSRFRQRSQVGIPICQKRTLRL